MSGESFVIHECVAGQPILLMIGQTPPVKCPWCRTTPVTVTVMAQTIPVIRPERRAS